MRRSLLLDVLTDRCNGSAFAATVEKDGDQSAPPDNLRRMLGWFFFRIMRLETPFRLFTSADKATLGGWFTSRCTRSCSPSNSTSSASTSVHTLANTTRISSRISFVKTPRLYLVTKTKCTCIKKTLWRPCPMSLPVFVDQIIFATMERLQVFKFEGSIKSEVQHLPRGRCAHAKKKNVPTASA